MAGLLTDVRFSARSFRRYPGHTSIVIATLAVGIAACTLVFSIINAIFYRPFDAYRDPDRLVLLFEQNARGGYSGLASAAAIADWRRAARSFERIGGVGPAPVTLTGGAEPETMLGVSVTDQLLDLVGARAQIGRVLGGGDFASGAPPVAVVTHELWQRRFGGSRDIAGRAATINGRPVTIVGVLARSSMLKPLLGMEPEIVTPLAVDGPLDRSQRSLFAVARLTIGASVADARREMGAVSARIAAANPESRGWGVYVKPVRGLDFRGDAAFLVVLVVGVLFVLAIVCANVMNLLLMRGAARTREIATRLAIGAGRLAIVRQLFVEALMLGLAGVAAATVIAWGACRALAWSMSGSNISWLDLQVDTRVLALTTGVSLVTAVVAAFAPAFGLARTSVNDALKENASGWVRVAPGRLRNLLVAGEIGLALVLLVGSGLVLEGVVHVRQNDPGFLPTGLVVVNTRLSDVRYQNPAARVALVDEVLARLRSRGELRSVAATDFIPMAGGEVPAEAFAIDGRAADGERLSAGVIGVSDGYFDTLGIRLRAGRLPGPGDRATTMPIAVVNQRMTTRWFKGENPIGRRIQVGGAWRTIVGVVGDVRNFHLNVAPGATIYVPFVQKPAAVLAVFARTRSTAPEAMATAIKGDIRAVDPNLAVNGGRSMPEMIERSMGGFDMGATVVAILALVAMTLASVGIYGVVACSVARRSREIGIRVALGAAPRQVTRQIVGEGVRMALVGCVPGLLLAAAVGRLLASKLHRVSPVDPLVFGVASLVVLSSVLVASYVPARRAAALDPTTATRSE